MKKLLLTLLLACTASAYATQPENANQAKYAQAVQAYTKHNFQAAFRILKPLAKQGDKTAQHNLAVLYQDGLGVKADAKQALYWYEQAAKQGEAEAQFMAGKMYSDGDGVEQDYAKAVYWYTKAAEQGHNEAQNNLAARYATGTGVEKNIARQNNGMRKLPRKGMPPPRILCSN